MTTDRRRCSATYPSASTMPNTRIVHCHLEAGHPGEHEEEGTEVTWLPDEPVVPTPAEPREPARGGIVSSFTTWSPLDIPAPFELPKPMSPEAVEEWMARFRELMSSQRITVLPPTEGERERAAYERGKAEAQVHAEVIVPCRDTREDLDGALCTGEFRYGPHDIQAKCTVCGGWRGRWAPAEMSAYERGKAEGLRQATEGWEREWALKRSGSLGVYGFRNEATAREAADRNPELTLLARLVGPWEPADTSADSEGADRD